jgi:hypothetical protein
MATSSCWLKSMYDRKGMRGHNLLLEARAKEFMDVASKKHSESKAHATAQAARWEVVIGHKSLP